MFVLGVSIYIRFTYSSAAGQELAKKDFLQNCLAISLFRIRIISA